MQIIKKVLIKQRITENSQKVLKSKLNQKRMQLEQEIQQLHFEQRKVQQASQISKHTIADRFKKELDSRNEQIQLLAFKLEQLDILPLDSEIVETEVEALVEVKEGMHWKEFMNEGVIVLEDNIIIRIEDGR